MTTEMRLCRVCIQEKPLTAFPVYNHRGMRRFECGPCMRNRHQKYLSDEWQDKAANAKEGLNLHKIYAGKNHCWCCRKPVKESGDVVLCKTCNGDTNGQ